tara:strand:- start:10035 stop:10322 length:288 start_codon:yes stop_codon:yes gene_type:complete
VRRLPNGEHATHPETIRVDNGPEFISKSLDWWAYWNRVKLDFSRPGKPTDNAFIEFFSGRLRQGRKDYNERRPLSALGNRTPQEFAKFSDQACLV